ncbi:MAG TPA: hypothetical protein VKD90_25580 [Gemmataceae bacterium]|nr:hypothetical protein [Gemmataceae bacterium]
MTETLTLELPPDVARRARALAAATNRRLEDVVVEWIGRAAADASVEALPDADIMELAHGQLAEHDQAVLSDLLGRQPNLTDDERTRLEELLGLYRRGLVLKARAVKEAVARGLVPRLDGHAA